MSCSEDFDMPFRCRYRSAISFSIFFRLQRAPHGEAGAVAAGSVAAVQRASAARRKCMNPAHKPASGAVLRAATRTCRRRRHRAISAAEAQRQSTLQRGDGQGAVRRFRFPPRLLQHFDYFNTEKESENGKSPWREQQKRVVADMAVSFVCRRQRRKSRHFFIFFRSYSDYLPY